MNQTFKQILHFGLQRSGTNYLESFLKLNFKVEILNNKFERNHPLHKHFRIYDDKNIICDQKYYNNKHYDSLDSYLSDLNLSEKIEGIIIISKDPYSWFLSYNNWAISNKWSKPSFHFIEEYNLFYKKWMELAAGKQEIHFIRYIDLISNEKLVIKELKQNLNLTQRRSFFGLFSIIHKPKKVSVSEIFDKNRARYYINQEYLKDLSRADFEEINNLIDRELIDYLGYEILNK